MFAVVQKYLAGLKDRWSTLGTLWRLLVVACAVLVFAIVAFWLNELFFYVLARSYVNDIADVFNLNKHLAKAITLVVGVTAAYLAWKTFSLSAGRRQIGYFGILGLLIGYSILLWQGTKDQIFNKCYVITHEGDVLIREQPGIDPVTGRSCRPVTPDLVYLLEEYGKGRRPQRIASHDPTFFNPRSGEPSVWYFKDKDGAIQIFDLMGFHPETGEELQPVTRDIVDVWKAQQKRVAADKLIRPPRQIDPENFPFFDALTGEPRVWYWRGANGEYEFYDHPGYHPRTGEQLAVITKEAIAAWRSALQQAADFAAAQAQQQQAVLERQQRHAAELAAAQAQAQQAALEQQQRQEAELAAAQERAQQAAPLCDQLAANPTDPRKPAHVSGVRYDDLKTQAKAATQACTLAMQTYPGEQRYRYQYARALQVDEPEKALDVHKELARNNYPASFDNVGWLLIRTRKDIQQAIGYFKDGVRRGDPDSMVSLADLIDRHYYVPENDPTDTRFALLSRAAQLGHPGAQLAVEQERIKFQQQQIQQQNQQQQEQLMIQMFGTILQSVAH
jgi:hypothetical protein